MTELNQDILTFAITQYLSIKDESPYWAMIECSMEENDTHDWAVFLPQLLANSTNMFKREETLNADPARNIELFNKQLKKLHDRTVKVATVGGMLCQKWISEDLTPYTDNKHFDESNKFIENTVITFS